MQLRPIYKESSDIKIELLLNNIIKNSDIWLTS